MKLIKSKFFIFVMQLFILLFVWNFAFGESMEDPILKNQGREAHGKILSTIAKIVDESKLKPLIDLYQFTVRFRQAY